jgi:chaperonin GroES
MYSFCCLDECILKISCAQFYILKSYQTLCRSLAPLADRILVRRAAKEVQTAGGLYLPTDKVKNPNEAEVIAVGPGMRDVTGNQHAPTLKVGDKVLLPEYGGTSVKIDDDEYFLFREDDILGKFE